MRAALTVLAAVAWVSSIPLYAGILVRHDMARKDVAALALAGGLVTGSCVLFALTWTVL